MKLECPNCGGSDIFEHGETTIRRYITIENGEIKRRTEEISTYINHCECNECGHIEDKLEDFIIQEK